MFDAPGESLCQIMFYKGVIDVEAITQQIGKHNGKSLIAPPRDSLFIALSRLWLSHGKTLAQQLARSSGQF